ncbi:MAG: hypothetical protein AAF434_18690 [Pseudomonadota bacterium]
MTKLLLTFFAFFFPFLIYLLVAPTVYRAEVYFLAPQLKDIQPLNIVNTVNAVRQFDEVSVDDVYQKFLTNLDSRNLRWEFFEQQNLLEHFKTQGDLGKYQVFLEEFNEFLVVTKPESTETESAKIHFDMTESDTAAESLQAFVDFVMNRTVIDLADGVQSELDATVAFLENEAATKLKLAKLRREDYQQALHEALVVARRVGIRSSDLVSTNKTSQSMTISIDNNGVPLYTRGVEVLEAELEVLKNRENDEAFVSGLRNVQEQLDKLKTIRIERNSIHPARLDQRSVVLDKPASPDVKRILMIGFVLSLFFTFILHLAWYFLRGIDFESK